MVGVAVSRGRCSELNFWGPLLSCCCCCCSALQSNLEENRCPSLSLLRSPASLVSSKSSVTTNYGERGGPAAAACCSSISACWIFQSRGLDEGPPRRSSNSRPVDYKGRRRSYWYLTCASCHQWQLESEHF